MRYIGVIQIHAPGPKMQDALEDLAELIRRANIQNNSPGSWCCILPSGEATYAGHKFPNVADMLAAVQEMADATGPAERIHKSRGGYLPEEMIGCCALPGATRKECQWASNGKTYCRCSCHNG